MGNVGSQGYRAETGILTEYHDVAVMENHEALIKGFPVFCESVLAKLWSSQANTVRQALSWLSQAAGLSRTLQEHLNSAKIAVDTVVRLLGVPIITKLTLKRLPKLARLPDVISRIRIMRPTWFNPE